MEDAKDFFSRYGFVVFRDILDKDECAATVAEIWTYLEQHIVGLQRGDSATWDHLPSERYGLPEAQAIFTPQVVANRQSSQVYAAFDALLPCMQEPVQPWDSPHPSANGPCPDTREETNGCLVRSAV